MTIKAIATFSGDKIIEAYFPTLFNKSYNFKNAYEGYLATAALIGTPHGLKFDQRDFPYKKIIDFEPCDLQRAVSSTEDAYYRLQLLSSLQYKPNTINLDGIFGFLPNNVFTSFGAFSPESFEKTKEIVQYGLGGCIFAVDKFPRLIDYVIPNGVRIADAWRVRLGAYLSPGTTIMHEGFVNFNAGTLGASMIEGRVSQGVVLGDGTDIGGGASIMGTLSGGGKEIISVGQKCLLGANSGLGISLGDNCTVEAGLYLTSGTKVIYKECKLKAKELSGKSNLLFRRNSLSGSVEALDNKAAVELNKDLHL